MATFLTPVTITLHNLRHRGVNWQPNINEERRSRFMLLIVSADSEERYTIFGMTRHNGRFGCTCCLVNGVRNIEAANHTRIYPVENEENVRERTDLSIRRNSRRADREEYRKMVLKTFQLSILLKSIFGLHSSWNRYICFGKGIP